MIASQYTYSSTLPESAILSSKQGLKTILAPKRKTKTYRHLDIEKIILNSRKDPQYLSDRLYSDINEGCFTKLEFQA